MATYQLDSITPNDTLQLAVFKFVDISNKEHYKPVDVPYAGAARIIIGLWQAPSYSSNDILHHHFDIDFDKKWNIISITYLKSKKSTAPIINPFIFHPDYTFLDPYLEPFKDIRKCSNCGDTPAYDMSQKTPLHTICHHIIHINDRLFRNFPDLKEAGMMLKCRLTDQAKLKSWYKRTNLVTGDMKEFCKYCLVLLSFSPTTEIKVSSSTEIADIIMNKDIESNDEKIYYMKDLKVHCIYADTIQKSEVLRKIVPQYINNRHNKGLITIYNIPDYNNSENRNPDIDNMIKGDNFKVI